MKALKTIGKILLYFVIIIFIILLIGAGIIWGYQKYKHHQLAKELEALPIDDSLSYENTLHNYMDETIDDNEMTVEEKLDRGLNPYKTDTSGNGLSDAEAVEQGLDPTKFSTTDDGISDYVKIEEGLDPKEEVDPKDIEAFTIEDEDLGTTLRTNDLNAKYFSSVEHYEQDELDEIYQPVRDPIRVHNYEGEMLVDMPDGEDKDISAFYFNFEKGEMEKVKKQKWADDSMMLNITKNDPIYFFADDLLDEIGDYYYFRISPYIFGPGYDHKVFIFKRGLFTDDLFKDEKIDDDEYGVVEISKAEISYIYSLFLDTLYKMLDTIFQPLDNMDENMYTRIWIDYGKLEGTPEYVEYYVMPWLHEESSEEEDDEKEEEEIELETENENSKKVIDSGFRTEHHAFHFGNFRTELGDNGVCAGISRTTEFIYNGKDIKSKQKYKPENWRRKLINFLDKEEYSEFHYDISENEEDYPFLDNGELYDYTFTDDKISHLTKDEPIDDKLEIQPDNIAEPDYSLIRLLETQWMISNDKKKMSDTIYPYSGSVIDQVEEYLADGQIIYASLSNGSGGHSVSIYKMEYDRYDDDLIRLYVYDPNLPYQQLTDVFNTEEVYMEIHKNEMKHNKDEEYFEFDYTPFEDMWESYSFSEDTGYTMLLYHNDDLITKK